MDGGSWARKGEVGDAAASSPQPKMGVWLLAEIFLLPTSLLCMRYEMKMNLYNV